MKTKTRVHMKFVYDIFLWGMVLTCSSGVIAINLQMI